MVTKEQCILKRILELVDYRRCDDRFLKVIETVYNKGKKYVSDMIFRNDDKGIDEVLGGMSEEDAEYFWSMAKSDDNYDYDWRDPFVTFDGGLVSLEAEEVGKRLTPEMVKEIVDTLEWKIDDSDFLCALEYFVESNYPDAMENWTGDWEERNLYNVNLLSCDWDELASTLTDGETLELTEDELKSIVNKSVSRLLEDSGIHIDPANKGKFTATKKRTGKSTEELTHSKNPLTRKRANFARMAKRGWEPLKKS